jgi:hypothetical protein
LRVLFRDWNVIVNCLLMIIVSHWVDLLWVKGLMVIL